MVFKKLFGSSKQEISEADYTIEDLFVLERYEEAEGRLKARLKASPGDLHAHLRLADVYIQLRQLSKAAEEYVYVAEEYASDGFFDKGIALLLKVRKLVPMDDNLPKKIEVIQQRKRLERVREQALRGLSKGMGGGGKGGTSALELEGLWSNLLRSVLVRKLDGDQLEHLFSCMTLERKTSGEVLAERNSDLQALYIIVRGEVEASASVGGSKPIQLRAFSSGDLVGEAAVLEKKPWPATYLVKKDAILLQLTREGLEKALTGNADPRGLLAALRDQNHDHEIVLALQKLAT